MDAVVNLVRTKLHQLRSQFLAAATQYPRLKCRLDHWEPEEGECIAGPRHDEWPPLDESFVSFAPADYRELRWKVDADGFPQFIDRPYLDARGLPIANSAKQGFALIPPASRNLAFYGEPKAFERFASLAVQGGRCLAAMRIPPDIGIATDSWTAPDDSNRWIWCVFDVGWHGRHPSIQAERFLWINKTRVPYNLRALNGLARSVLKLPVPPSWLEHLPLSFSSEVLDVMSASADFIDLLLSQELARVPKPDRGGSIEAMRQASGLILDPRNCDVVYNGRLLTIPRQAAFDLFSILHANVDRLVSYAECLKAGWPRRHNPQIRIMEMPSEVREAKKKIDAALRAADCPYRLEVVRLKGLILRPPAPQ